MIPVGWLFCHLDAHETDNRRTGVGKVVEGVSGDGHAVEQAS